MDKPVLTFVQPETIETKVLYNVLSALRIEDIELSYEDGTLVAKDEDNTWKGRDFYRFLTDEVFVYDKDGGVLGLDNELLDSFKEYADKNEIYLMAASSADEATTQEWVNEIKEYFDGIEVLCDDLSLGICCHTGEGALGIGCSCKPKRK